MIIIRTDEDELFFLACRFRGTRVEAERKEIAAEYAEVIDRLIKSGTWVEMPSPEDMLPWDYMPQSFKDYVFS